MKKKKEDETVTANFIAFILMFLKCFDENLKY